MRGMIYPGMNPGKAQPNTKGGGSAVAGPGRVDEGDEGGGAVMTPLTPEQRRVAPRVLKGVCCHQVESLGGFAVPR